MSAELVYLREHLSQEPPPPRMSDRAQFEQLVRRHDPQLRRLVTAIVGRVGAVDDVLQETYIKAFRRLPRFESEAHEARWLCRVAYRCSLDELRRRRRRPEFAQPDVRIVSDADDPVGRIGVERALASLSSDHRAALVLVDLLGFDYPAAARILRVPRGTVASRVNRARAQLERALA